MIEHGHRVADALAHARALAAKGAALAPKLSEERQGLLKAIAAELLVMQTRMAALRPAARAGDAEAAAKVTRMAELQGELLNAQAALQGVA